MGRQALYPIRPHRLPRELLLAEMEEDIGRGDAEDHAVHGEHGRVGQHDNPFPDLIW